MGKPSYRKKYETGEAQVYMSRKHAMAKLQLNLKDFRRLCILKGVFPREPKNRTRAQKGNSSSIKTLYFAKDIRFLLHEPIVRNFREMKIFVRKLKKAQDKKLQDKVEKLKANKPKYTLDHIVRERYPTFIDAIRDLEDCLCLVFLYATFPRTFKTPLECVDLCRKLSVEFMHYVIEAKALRKVFCSIKGFYFQADIKGQTVTWIIPHNFGFQTPGQVDMKLMSVFVDFYSTMLGFVNYRLYNGINLTYPPKLTSLPEKEHIDDGMKSEEDLRVFALNQSLHRTVIAEDNVELDNIPMNENDAGMEAAKKEAEAVEAQAKLFNGLKFFLGREVPREPLVFMIRSVGGEASWEKSVAPGATFLETDERITHHISDRPTITNKKLGRFYVQPQWIFDSINRREKLNEKNYAVGETLPPHLSPFVDASSRRIGDYVPPEEKTLLEGNKEIVNENEENEDEEENEEEESENEDEEENEEESGEEQTNDEVKIGTKEKVDKKAEQQQQDTEEFRLREMMIARKNRGLYKSMMKNRKRRANEADKLQRKRKMWEEENKPKKKKETIEA